MIEPPAFVLLLGLFGLICTFAGFIFLFGPHRHSSLGASLYLGGLGTVACVCMITVIFL